MENARSPRITRRAMLRLGGLATAAGLSSPTFEAQARNKRPDNAITRENALPGTTDWQLTKVRIAPETQYRSPWIEGYCSRSSVLPGEKIDVMVSTNPPSPFTLDLYRMGYYGGKGARHLGTHGPFVGTTQPDPAIGPERLRECLWKSSTTLEIPAEACSGVYLGKLTALDSGYQSYVVFIVREERNADVVLQCSDNTWQAYNRWPDHFALYDDGESGWALKSGIRVSYDRPYGKYCQVTDSPLSVGSGEFLLWEYPLAFWLEREGYDLTYCSNTDVDADPTTVTRAKAFLSVGHDEYWSLKQYDHVMAGIQAGVNVLFLSGNTCYFVTPQAPSSDGRPRRILTRTGMFGGTRTDEAPRMGPFQMDGPDEALMIGARSLIPYNGTGDWIATRPEHWIFEGTDMKAGEGIPGLVGWEYHGDPAAIPGLEVVAEGETINSDGGTAHWTATIYPGPKNNFVFNASTIYWSQGLSSPPGHTLPYAHFGRPHGPDERVQRITNNLLQRALK